MPKFNPPESFIFEWPIEWPQWQARFSRYCIASKLTKEDGIVQVSSLIYAMGKDSEHIFQTFTFENQGDKDNYDIVLSKLDHRFMPKRNIVHERAIFHKRDQLPGESVEQYVRCLHELIEHCDYGADKQDHIRDRMAVGLLDAELKEKLQLLDECPLEKAIQFARQTELVKSQVAKQS